MGALHLESSICSECWEESNTPNPTNNFSRETSLIGKCPICPIHFGMLKKAETTKSQRAHMGSDQLAPMISVTFGIQQDPLRIWVSSLPRNRVLRIEGCCSCSPLATRRTRMFVSCASTISMPSPWMTGRYIPSMGFGCLNSSFTEADMQGPDLLEKCWF